MNMSPFVRTADHKRPFLGGLQKLVPVLLVFAGACTNSTSPEGKGEADASSSPRLGLAPLSLEESGGAGVGEYREQPVSGIGGGRQLEDHGLNSALMVNSVQAANDSTPSDFTPDDSSLDDAVLDDPVEVCDDTEDNDEDTLVDCFDPDCFGDPACSSGPDLTCPEDRTIECDGTDKGTELNEWLQSATAESACPNVSLVITNDFTELPLACGAAGSVTVIWTATDDCGTKACTATFEIVDSSLPNLDGPADQTIECDGATHETELSDWLAEATADDVCGSAELTDDFEALSDGCGETASATVEWTATDECGLTATHTATFEIVDTTAPTISGPDDVTVECDGEGNQADLDAWLDGVTGQDACGSATTKNDFAGLSDECGETGSATVTWMATDECGLTATHSAVFTIADSKAPTIDAPGDLTVECDGTGNQSDLDAWLDDFSTEDACGAVTVDNDFIGISDECAETGSVEVTWTAKDDCGLTATDSATAVVEDTTAPDIELNGPADMTVECGAESYEEPGASASDVCDTELASADVGGDSVDSTTPGTYIVTYSATDACGNASDELERTVDVVDSLPPVVTLNPMIHLWPPNHKYVTVSLSDCVERVVDACEGELDLADAAEIVSVYSDEPEDVNGNGDGRTTDDIVILSNATVHLRAERQGAGNGRVYGITFTVADRSGNETEAVCLVGVPHDQSGDPPIDDGASAGYQVP